MVGGELRKSEAGEIRHGVEVLSVEIKLLAVKNLDTIVVWLHAGRPDTQDVSKFVQKCVICVAKHFGMIT